MVLVFTEEKKLKRVIVSVQAVHVRLKFFSKPKKACQQSLGKVFVKPF